MNRIAIIMGSESDREVVDSARGYLEFFGLDADVQVLSAHRHPEALRAYLQRAEQQGVAVFIACAGMAAHLGGAIAAHTTRPVIGVPLAAGSLNGLDALLSMVQMPAGVPVATMAIGKAGMRNAVVLAAQMLALNDQRLRRRLDQFKQQGCKL